ncbi:MAG: long-chain fatty acid--CoA ligase [Hyphomicrobiales bacterium]
MPKTGPNAAPQQYPWLGAYPQGIPWDKTYKPRILSEILDDSASRFAGQPCTSFLGRTLTYGEIGRMADRTAAALQAMGVGKGSRVGLLLPNTPTYIVFYFAILKAGGTVVNFNPLYTVEELRHQIRDSGTGIMVTLDLVMTFRKVEPLLQEGSLEKAIVCPFAELLPGLKSLLFRLFKSGDVAKVSRSPAAAKILDGRTLMESDAPFKPPAIDPGKDIAVLQYTGGTTGTPKGAMLTHANLSVNVQQVLDWAEVLSPGQERIMAVLPFFHVFAMTAVLNFGVSKGSLLILMPRFELKEALQLIDSHKATMLPGVPTMYNAMINSPDLGRYDLTTLKFCISGGAALPIEVKRAFETLTGCKLVEGYGLSETSPVATCNPPQGPVREGSIGLPLPGTVISIRSIDDPEKEMPLKENGEICIAGPQVMPGYWEKPEETADAFTGRFFRTGDVGYMDSEGFTYIVDRLKDMINASGFKVYPRRIEEALYEHPAVEEVTVIGIPDEYRGEAPKAFVKLRKNGKASEEELFEFLKPKISKIEMPAEIEFRDVLPKTMIGKLSKKELRQEEEPSPAAD